MVKIKRGMKNKPIITDEQKASEEPYGTQWPKVIGAARNPKEDDKIRDSRGLVTEGLFCPKQ